jgi:hypothetical protein
MMQNLIVPSRAIAILRTAFLSFLALCSDGFGFYQAEKGRWMSRDLAGEQGGANLYIFVSNDMIDSVDLLGLAKNDPPSIVSCECCCCADTLSIQNVGNTTFPGRYGHKFDVVVDTSWRISPNGKKSDCKLEWWEWSTLTLPGVPPSNWADLYPTHSSSPVFAGWNSRTKLCLRDERATLTDQPSGLLHPSFSGTQNLYFAIVVRSAANCNCKANSLVVYAHQYWNITSGVGQGKSFSVLDTLPTPPGAISGVP